MRNWVWIPSISVKLRHGDMDLWTQNWTHRSWELVHWQTVYLKWSALHSVFSPSQNTRSKEIGRRHLDAYLLPTHKPTQVRLLPTPYTHTCNELIGNIWIYHNRLGHARENIIKTSWIHEDMVVIMCALSLRQWKQLLGQENCPVELPVYCTEL